MRSPIRILKSAWFHRFARKEGITDQVLVHAVMRAEQGLVDAVLGGNVIKQRVARQGQGASGGYRTIILYRTATRAIFMYGFAKSDRDNLDVHETTQYKKAAVHMLGLSDQQLDSLIRIGKFTEINRHD